MMNLNPLPIKPSKLDKKVTKAFVLDNAATLNAYEELSNTLNLRSQQDVFEYMIRCTNYVLAQLHKEEQNNV